MIYLDKNSTNVTRASTAHHSFLHCRITKRLTGKNCSDGNCNVCKSTYKDKGLSGKPYKRVVAFLTRADHLKKILSGDPEELLAINQQFYAGLLTPADTGNMASYYTSDKTGKKAYKAIHGTIEAIKHIFDYKWFIGLEPESHYSAYHLAENLSMRSCTYCNRTYTTTMKSWKGGKLMRPQFDHWFPKSKYPLLALSFYNLIPCCYTCNSAAKLNIELDLREHVHPYIDADQADEFSFDYFYSGRSDRYRIFIKTRDTNQRKALQTIKALKIDTMYNAHHDELKDLIQIKRYYSDAYIKEIRKLFPANDLKFSDVYRMLFGTEVDSTDFHKRPLSKFKRDILRKLNIID